jgi:hypothetical protein
MVHGFFFSGLPEFCFEPMGRRQKGTVAVFVTNLRLSVPFFD